MKLTIQDQIKNAFTKELNRFGIISLNNDNYELFHSNMRLEEDGKTVTIEKLQECIRLGSLEPVQEMYDTYYNAAYDDNLFYYKNEIKKLLIQKFDEEDVEQFYEDDFNIEFIEESIGSKDNNSYDFVGYLNSIKLLNCFIPLGQKIHDFWQYDIDSAEYTLIWENFLIPTFKLDPEDLEMKKNIFDIFTLANSSELSIWFTFHMSDFYVIEKHEEYEIPTFKLPTQLITKKIILAAHDFESGCGDHLLLELPNEVSFELTNENIFFDYITGYSYVHEVCMMIKNWNDSEVRFSNEPINDDSNVVRCKTKLVNKVDKLKEYAETYDNGGCTYDDKNMNQHQTVYKNEFMNSRWECVNCGRTWLD